MWLGNCPNSFGCIERFHMTSRRPYWCFKTIKRQPCWLTLGVELFSHVNDLIFLFQWIIIDAGHVSENAQYVLFWIPQSMERSTWALYGREYFFFFVVNRYLSIQLNHKRFLWQLVIGNWALRIWVYRTMQWSAWVITHNSLLVGNSKKGTFNTFC